MGWGWVAPVPLLLQVLLGAGGKGTQHRGWSDAQVGYCARSSAGHPVQARTAFGGCWHWHLEFEGSQDQAPSHPLALGICSMPRQRQGPCSARSPPAGPGRLRTKRQIFHCCIPASAPMGVSLAAPQLSIHTHDGAPEMLGGSVPDDAMAPGTSSVLKGSRVLLRHPPPPGPATTVLHVLLNHLGSKKPGSWKPGSCRGCLGRHWVPGSLQ